MGQLKNLREALTSCFEKLNIEISDLDWIMVEVLGVSRSELTRDYDLTRSQVKQIYHLAKKRMRGIPLSQVLGSVDFYGRKFAVNKYVLSPRPETELLVEQILKNNEVGSGLDIGTGSGAIAITLSNEKNLKMTAVDISGRALRVAKKNNNQLNARVKFIKSNLFERVVGTYDFIVSNPPYIASNEIEFLDDEVKNHEPRLALDGGNEGLEIYDKIIKDAPKFLKAGGKIYFEVGVGQADAVKKMLMQDFVDIKIIKDYNKIDRIVIATKKEEERKEL